MTSRHLNALQLRGLLKVGDVLIPGDDTMPSFSRSRCIEQSDRMFDYMNRGDLMGVKALLGVFFFLPRLALRGVFALTDLHRKLPDPLGTVLRLINIGLKGVVMTLYYSDIGVGPSIHERIGWDAKVVERPEEA